MVDTVNTQRFVRENFNQEQGANTSSQVIKEPIQEGKERLNRLINDFKELDKSFKRGSNTGWNTEAEADFDLDENSKRSTTETNRVEMLFKRDELRKQQLAEKQQKQKEEVTNYFTTSIN